MNKKSLTVVVLLLGLVSGVVYSQKPSQLQRLNDVAPGQYAFLASEMVTGFEPSMVGPQVQVTTSPTAPLSALSFE